MMTYDSNIVRLAKLLTPEQVSTVRELLRTGKVKTVKYVWKDIDWKDEEVGLGEAYRITQYLSDTILKNWPN